MLRVALAEDDAGLRIEMAELLREQGFDIVEAGDGATLIGVLHRAAVGLVVTDLSMPRLRGNDVLRHCRLLGDHTPFVVITGAAEHLTEDAMLFDAVTLVRKPFTEEMLLEAVARALDQAA